MDIKHLSESISVAPQLEPAEVAEVAQRFPIKLDARTDDQGREWFVKPHPGRH